VAGDYKRVSQGLAVVILFGDGGSQRYALRQVIYDGGTGNNMTCPPGTALCIQKLNGICWLRHNGQKNPTFNSNIVFATRNSYSAMLSTLLIFQRLVST
jgi:hypothetical protein